MLSIGLGERRGIALIAFRSLAGPFVLDAVVGSRPELEPAGTDVWRIVTAPLASTGTTVLVTGCWPPAWRSS